MYKNGWLGTIWSFTSNGIIIHTVMKDHPQYNPPSVPYPLYLTCPQVLSILPSKYLPNWSASFCPMPYSYKTISIQDLDYTTPN